MHGFLGRNHSLFPHPFHKVKLFPCLPLYGVFNDEYEDIFNEEWLFVV